MSRLRLAAILICLCNCIAADVYRGRHRRNSLKLPPEFETIGGENDEKQANHDQNTSKTESNCQFCGLNLAMARRNIIYLVIHADLHDFSICKQLFYIEKHWHVCNNQDWVCVAPPIEYAWCQFKMTSSKCPYRSKHQYTSNNT